ncbi:hypothetical protein [Halogranum rubrum]|uniref:Uncharacterized protein n=1 Tax=Halogranum salarium B-1 TaxID=1210908 RepID=J3A5X5_9EURY|nr:hypothetical protein [Halogranum salarium]EJN60883.1 hypothetical protein HSB1_14860 [Halogranum salarium B-1]
MSDEIHDIHHIHDIHDTDYHTTDTDISPSSLQVGMSLLVGECFTRVPTR